MCNVKLLFSNLKIISSYKHTQTIYIIILYLIISGLPFDLRHVSSLKKTLKKHIYTE